MMASFALSLAIIANANISPRQELTEPSWPFYLNRPPAAPDNWHGLLVDAAERFTKATTMYLRTRQRVSTVNVQHYINRDYINVPYYVVQCLLKVCS